MVDLPPSEIQCVAQAIYAEARSESETGRRAVGHVILNRMRDPRFPSTACGVVQQRGQFTYRVGRGNLWQRSLDAARALGNDPTRGSLYFRPLWNPMRGAYRLVRTIGNHIFYKR